MIPRIPDLPDDLTAALMLVSGTASTAHVNEQQYIAAMALNSTRDARELRDALRDVGRAYTKDIRGHIIPLSQNWLHRNAGLLAAQVEGWIQEQRRIAA